MFSFFIVLALIVIYIRFIEKRTIFYPAKGIEYSPKEFDLDFEEVFFKTVDNVEINGWFIPAKDSSKAYGYTILFCHGNAGNISHRIEKIKLFSELGCSVFIFDYRGYGKSRGFPSEKGMYLDCQGAYDYLLSRKIAAEQIIGYGESLGGAVIIDLVSKNKLKSLIIESSFTSAKDMAKIIYPFLPSYLLSLRLDAASKIKFINIPKLIIHSKNDEIVPYKIGMKLYDEAAVPKEFLEVRGGHNSCFYESEDIIKAKIADFLRGL